jgi:hypothetical protein
MELITLLGGAVRNSRRDLGVDLVLPLLYLDVARPFQSPPLLTSRVDPPVSSSWRPVPRAASPSRPAFRRPRFSSRDPPPQRTPSRASPRRMSSQFSDGLFHINNAGGLMPASSRWFLCRCDCRLRDHLSGRPGRARPHRSHARACCNFDEAARTGGLKDRQSTERTDLGASCCFGASLRQSTQQTGALAPALVAPGLGPLPPPECPGRNNGRHSLLATRFAHLKPRDWGRRSISISMSVSGNMSRCGAWS